MSKEPSQHAIKIGEAAKILGVSVKTLRRWEEAKKIKARRTPGGTRFYSINALKKVNPALKHLYQEEVAPVALASKELPQTVSVDTETLLKRVKESNESEESEVFNLPLTQSASGGFDSSDSSTLGGLTPSKAAKSKLFTKFLIGSAGMMALTLVITVLLTVRYLITPAPTSPLSQTSQAQTAGVLSPFNQLAEQLVAVIAPQKAKELGLSKPEPPPPVAFSLLPVASSNVLAETASSPYLEINGDTQILGSLSVSNNLIAGSINGLTLEATSSANSLSLTSGETTLTVTNDATLDQDLSTTSSPTFASINLTSSSLVGRDTTDTLTNKSLSGSSNTFTNIPATALTDAKVTVSAGTNLTGGGEVKLGNSISIALKDSVAIAGTLSLPDGTAAAPSLNFTSDTDTGLYRISANKIGLITAGSATSGITIDANGNVGIATITPTSKLHVVGTANVTGATTLTSSSLSVGGVAYTFPSSQGAADTTLVNNGSGTLSWTSLATAGGWTVDGNNIYLTNMDGNVGIGSSVPGYKLAVNGPGYFSGFVGIGSSLNVSGNVGIGQSLTVSSAAILDSLSVTKSISAATLGISGTSNLAATNVTSLQNSGGTLFGTLSVSDKPTGGNIGTAATTVDIYTSIALNQTTSGQTITLPDPTDTTAGRIVYISNTGSATFTFLNSAVQAGTTTAALWNGTTWTLAGGGGLTPGVTDNSTLRWNSSSTQWVENGNILSTSTGTMGLNGNLGVGTTGSLDYNLKVLGTGYFSGFLGVGSSMNVSGNVGIGSSLTVTSGVNFLSSLNVTGNTNLSTLNATNINSSTLTTTGNVGVGSSLTVTSGVNFSSSLNVLGLTSLQGLDATNINASTLTTTGNVGIGATTSSNKLDVWGNSRITGTLTVDQTSTFGGNLTLAGNLLPSINDNFDLGSDSARWANVYIGPSTLHIGTSTSDEYTIAYDTTNNYLGFNVNGSGAAEIAFTSSGNLGIGTSTANSNLSVVGNAHIGSTRQGISAPTDGLFVDGNVGIGATTSSNKLDVWGNARITGALTVDGNLTIGSLNSDTQILANDGTAALPGYSFTNDTDSGLWRLGDNQLALTTSGSAISGLTINASGNIGIGTTSPANPLEIASSLTSGTIFNIAYPVSTTLTGNITGQAINLNSGRVSPDNNSVTGQTITLPTLTNSSGTNTLKGLVVTFGSGSGINQNSAGALTYTAADLSMPALTQTQGTLTANGMLVTTPSSITTGGTANAVNVSATGVGAGTLNGLNIGNITGGDGTEVALNIGTGWDSVLKVGSTVVINGSGVTQVAGGGTGIASYNVGDLLYASAEGTITNLGVGTSGQVLTTTAGVPVWGNINGGSCTTCLINNPTSNINTISPTGQATTGLSVRQTSTADPTGDMFNVTSSDGVTKYFYVDKDGNVSTGGGQSSTTITLTPTSDTTALTLVGTNVSTANLAYFNSKNAQGTIFNIAYGSSQSLTGTLIGQAINFTNLGIGASNQSVTGSAITMPGVTNTNTEGTNTYNGVSVTSSSGLNQNGAGTTISNGISVTIPALTQTAGSLTGNGVLITTPSSITTGGTASGLNISATGIGAGTLYGINLSGISAGAGSETALILGSGWDTLISNANFTVTGIGNVGIGTSNPTRAIDVVGTGNISGNVGIGGSLTLTSAGVFNSGLTVSAHTNLATLSTTGAARFASTGWFGGNVGIGTSATGAALQVNGGALFGWGTTSATAPTNGLAVSGNVGIGTTTASYKLDLISSSTTGSDFRIVNNSLTTGDMAYLSSTSTALTTGNLFNLDWSPTVSTTATTGSLLNIGIGVSGMGANFLNLNDAGSSVFSISQTALTTSLPVNFTSPGDVSIAYDLNFSNPTTSNIKSQAPLTITAGEIFNSSDLTLQTYNSGNINLDPGPGGLVQVGIGSSAPFVVNGQALIGTGFTTGTAPLNGLGVQGNVGIGTTTASYNLSVIGTANFTGNVGIGATTSNNKLDVWGNARIAGTTTIDSTLTALNGLFGYSGATAPASGLAVSGNVGIGTTSPAYKLDVNGTTRLTSITDNSAAPASGGFINIGYDTYTLLGMNNAGASSRELISWGKAGTDILRFAGDGNITNFGGNVGIGVTSPTQALELAGTMLFRPTAASGQKGCIRFDATNQDLEYSNDCTTFQSLGATAGGWSDQGTYTRLTTTTANVGIGVTYAPIAKLQISGNGSSTGLALLTQNSTQSQFGLAVLDNGSVGIGVTNPSQFFQVNPSGTSAFVVQSNGNIGIGFTSPTALLHTNKTFTSALDYGFYMTDPSASSGYFGIGEGTGTANSFRPFIVGKSAGTANSAGLQIRGIPIDDGTAGDTAILLQATNAAVSGATSNADILQVVNYTTNVLTINKGGNVGIGFTSPGKKLEIYGTAAAGDRPVMRFNHAGDVFAHIGGGETIGGASHTDLAIEAKNNIYFGINTGSNGTMILNSSGNVGINDNTPSYKLEVNGSFNATSVYSNGVLLSPGTGSNWTLSGGNIYRDSGNVGIGSATVSNQLTVSGGIEIIGSAEFAGTGDGFYHQGDNGIGIVTGGNPRITVLSGGNVGIGTATPSEKLHVASTTDAWMARFANNAASYGATILLDNTDTTTVDEQRIGGIDWLGYTGDGTGAGTNTELYNRIISFITDATGGTEDSRMDFYTMSAGASTNAMSISSGNVGIGFTSPASLMHLLSTGVEVRLESTAALNASRLRMINNAGGNWYVGAGAWNGNSQFQINDGSSSISQFNITTTGNIGIGTTVPGSPGVGTAPVLEIYGADPGIRLHDTAGGENTILTNNGKLRFFTGTTEAMDIDTNGNVGINDSTPSYTLEVAGTLNVTGAVTCGSGCAAGPWTSYGSNVAFTSGNVGIGTTVPIEKLVVGSFTSGADSYLKFETDGSSRSTGIKMRDLNNNYGFTLQNDQTNALFNIIRHYNDSAGVSALAINRNTGNVGIGFTSPNTALTVGTALSSTGNYWTLPSYNGISYVNMAGTDHKGSLHLEGNQIWGNAWVDVITFRNNQSTDAAVDKTIAAIGVMTNSSFDAEAGNLSFYTHDTTTGFAERMRIDSSGNVGIGTANTSAAAFSVMNGPVGIGTTNPYGGTTPLDVWNSSGNLIASFARGGATGNPGAIRVWNSARNYTDIQTNADGSFSLNPSAGNVGISTNTPGYKLEVNGSFNATSVYSGGVLLSPGTGSNWSVSGSNLYRSSGSVAVNTSSFYSADYGPYLQLNIAAFDDVYDSNMYVFETQNRAGGGGRISFGGVYTGTTNTVWGQISGAKTNATDTAHGGGLALSTRPNNGAMTERMRIDETGNVGIGFTSPGAKLDVAGGARLRYDSGTFELGGAFGGSYDRRFAGMSWDVAGGRDLGLLYGTTDLAFSAGGITNYTNMYIRGASGNVGIGTSGPNHKLSIVSASSSGLGLHSAADDTGTERFRMFLGDGTGGYSDREVYFQSQNTPLHFQAGTAGTTEIVTFLQGGNVGIGTASPVAKLHLTGTATTTGVNFLSTGAGGGGGLFGILDNGNVGIGTTTPGGSLVVTSGNVGIGITSPNYPLNLAGTFGIKQTQSDNTQGCIKYNSSTLQLQWSNDCIAYQAFSAPAAGGWTYDSINNYVRLTTSSSNVGIGTASPVGKLHLLGSGTGSTPTLMTLNSTSTKFGLTVLDNGNVGIGTSSPTTPLYVDTGSNTHELPVAIFRGSGSAQLLISEMNTSTGGMLIQSQTPGNNGWQNPDARFLSLNPSGGNVGIGTTAPVQKLEVAGGQASFAAGSGTTQNGAFRISPSNPAHAAVMDFGLAGSAGQWIQSTNRTDLSTNYPLLLNPNGGNVGIGITSPIDKLHVYGGNLRMNDGGAGSVDWQIEPQSALNFTDREANVTKLTINKGTTGSIAINAAGGNVGIGTASPGAKLDVETTSTPGQLLNLDATSASYADSVQKITVAATGSTSFSFIVGYSGGTADQEFNIKGDGSGTMDGAWSSPADYAEMFETNDTDLDKGELVSVDSNNPRFVKRTTTNDNSRLLGVISTKPGIIGIAADDVTDAAEERKNNPRWKIVGLLGQIPTKVSTENGNIEVGDYLTSSSTPGVAMKATHPGRVIGKALESYSSAGVDKIMVFISVGYADPNNSLTTLGTQVTTQGLTLDRITAAMMISDTGNIGIGVTPAAKLDIKGDSGQLFSINNSTSSLFNVSSSGNVGIGTTNSQFTLEINGTGKLNDAGWTYASDIRLKENVASIEGPTALSVVEGLNPVTFDYIEGGKNRSGFIAQEVQGVLPNLVTTGSDGMLGIRLEEMMPYAVKAIQEVNKKVNKQETELDKVKAQLAQIMDNLTISDDGTITVSHLKAGVITLDPSLNNTQISTTSEVGVSSQLANSSEVSAQIDLSTKIASLEERLRSLESVIASTSTSLSVNSTKQSSPDTDPTKIATDSSSPQSDEEIAGIATDSASPVIAIPDSIGEKQSSSLNISTQISTDSAQIATPSSDLTQTMIASSSSTPQSDDITLELTSPELLLASDSAQLTSQESKPTWEVLTAGSDANISGKLTSYDLDVQNGLKSLGKTTLGDTLIAGQLTVDGTMTITESSINSFSCHPELDSGSIQIDSGSGAGMTGCGILFIQNSPLAQLVDFFNGLVTIDKTGKLVAQAIVAKTVTTNKLIISNTADLHLPGESQATPSAHLEGVASEGSVRSASIGTAIIPAGSIDVPINTTAITANSKIFLTASSPTGGQLPFISYQEANIGFIVALEQAYSQDIRVNWWIIDTN